MPHNTTNNNGEKELYMLKSHSFRDTTSTIEEDQQQQQLLQDDDDLQNPPSSLTLHPHQHQHQHSHSHSHTHTATYTPPPTQPVVSSQATAIAACLLYSCCSILMTFSNKGVLSSYDFKWPMVLLLYQHVFSVAFVQTAKYFGFITVEPLQWSTVRKWLPVNMLFVGMLLSGTYTLKLLSVPMVTIFKNFTTLIVTAGDFFFFKQSISLGIVIALLLKLFGSVVAALNDLEFNALGYFWMLVNCVISAGYVLYMRTAMKGTKMSEFGNVYYNNVLSIPLLFPMLLANGADGITDFPMWRDPGFIVVAIIAGLTSVGISFSSFWTVRTTSPTTYSVVGSLTKIPLTILGVLIFHTPLTPLAKLSLLIGLSGGVLYSVVKRREMLKKVVQAKE